MPDVPVPLLHLDLLQTLTLATVVFYAGVLLRQRVPVLDRLNIPSAVVGGLLFAALFAAALVRGISRSLGQAIAVAETIAQGDRLHTDARARVSLRIGSSSVWLEENGDLVLAQLDEGRVSLQLEKGSLGLRLRTRDAVAHTAPKTAFGRLPAWHGRLRPVRPGPATRCPGPKSEKRHAGARKGP